MNTSRRDDKFLSVLEAVPVAFGLSQLKSMRDAAMRTKELTDLSKFAVCVGCCNVTLGSSYFASSPHSARASLQRCT